jgi:hypothetical protein
MPLGVLIQILKIKLFPLSYIVFASCGIAVEAELENPYLVSFLFLSFPKRKNARKYSDCSMLQWCFLVRSTYLYSVSYPKFLYYRFGPWTQSSPFQMCAIKAIYWKQQQFIIWFMYRQPPPLLDISPEAEVCNLAIIYLLFCWKVETI